MCIVRSIYYEGCPESHKNDEYITCGEACNKPIHVKGVNRTENKQCPSCERRSSRRASRAVLLAGRDQECQMGDETSHFRPTPGTAHRKCPRRDALSHIAFKREEKEEDTDEREEVKDSSLLTPFARRPSQPATPHPRSHKLIENDHKDDETGFPADVFSNAVLRRPNGRLSIQFSTGSQVSHGGDDRSIGRPSRHPSLKDTTTNSHKSQRDHRKKTVRRPSTSPGGVFTALTTVLAPDSRTPGRQHHPRRHAVTSRALRVHWHDGPDAVMGFGGVRETTAAGNVCRVPRDADPRRRLFLLPLPLDHHHFHHAYHHHGHRHSQQKQKHAPSPTNAVNLPGSRVTFYSRPFQFCRHGTWTDRDLGVFWSDDPREGGADIDWEDSVAVLPPRETCTVCACKERLVRWWLEGAIATMDDSSGLMTPPNEMPSPRTEEGGDKRT